MKSLLNDVIATVVVESKKEISKNMIDGNNFIRSWATVVRQVQD